MASITLHIIANPNTGSFTIKGSTRMPADEVTMVITDMLGQTIYKKVSVAKNGIVNQHIALPNSIAAGIYLVSIEHQW